MIHRLSQNFRLIIASSFAALIIFIWQALYVNPMLEEAREEQMKIEATLAINKEKGISPSPTVPIFDREALLREGSTHNTRVNFDNGVVRGSINLTGARLDDLVLSKYYKTLDKDSGNVVLMSPAKTQDAYFVEFGWLSSGDNKVDVPNANTLWKADKTSVKSTETVTLKHTNAQGVEFNIHVTLDEHYMFRFKQSVINHSGKNIELSEYALINRTNDPLAEDNIIIHEGAIGVADGTLQETKYEEIAKNGKMNFSNFNWVGFSDKYWLTALIPTSNADLAAQLQHYNTTHAQPRFQAGVNNKHMTSVPPAGKIVSPEIMVFAGAKELDVLDQYESKYNIHLFDRAVDFGILYFITKPIFELLHYFYDMVGNFGIAILILTVVIKIILFPLAYKGFKGMNRLKELQPKMDELRKKYADDATAFQRSLIELYKKEKVNPMGGCLPIFLQIPIFFALYKVLYVTIEMRHAPFFGWIKDLSVPDPYTIVNLFGLLPFDPPSFLMIGIFPILMALTMFLQQQLNPAPSDPIQAKVMKFLPVMFLFMFASFPSGLVIYWTWSNVLSIIQQVVIKRITTTR